MSKNRLDNNDALGSRIKSYEFKNRIIFEPKTYIVMRFDVSHCRTYVHSLPDLEKPFDNRIIEARNAAMLNICETTSGAVFGYSQSDEISIVAHDFNEDNSQLPFGGVMNKLITTGASKATWAFNQQRELQDIEFLRKRLIDSFGEKLLYAHLITDKVIKEVIENVIMAKKAEFDGRAIDLNDEQVRSTEYWKEKAIDIVDNLGWIEMHNAIFWRVIDCIKNSIAGVAQFHFSNKELHNKNGLDMIEMLKEIGDPWGNYSDINKFGTMCIRETTTDGRSKWIVKPMIDIRDKEIRGKFYRMIPEKTIKSSQ